jgi:hypothetical protein
MNPENWVSGLLPTSTDVVSFPPAFAQFGAARCPTVSLNCRIGGVVTIQAPASASTVALSLGKWVLPSNGKFSFLSNTQIKFVEFDSSRNTTVQSAWVDRNVNQGTDFKCANNWVVSGTNGKNTDFSIPCSQDKAIFPAVSLKYLSCLPPIMLLRFQNAIKVSPNLTILQIDKILMDGFRALFFRDERTW